MPQKTSDPFDGGWMWVHETYKNVSQEIRDQQNAKAEAIQIILTGIDNDIYSTVDACPNSCEMWKAIERLKQGESINVQDLETNLYWEFTKFTSQDGESLESYYSRFYKMMNELIRNQCNSQELKAVSYHKLYDILKQHQHEVNEIRAERIARVANPLALFAQQQPDNSPRINRSAGYENQRIGNVAGARETIGSTVKLKKKKDAAYHREKMLLCKQEEARIQLNVEQVDWRDDTDDDELEDQELEAHYMYMVQLQEVSPDIADSRPIFDDEPLKKVSNDDHYNVFAIESAHPEQSKSVHDTYPIKHNAQNVIIDSLDMSYNREEIDQNDDDNDLSKERELLASLIEKLKCKIDESKNRNKFLETSNKDFNNKNKSLESSNNYFKEANNRLSETNNLLYADYKKSEAELARRNSMEYASQMELECVKVRGDFLSYKMESQKSPPDSDEVIRLEKETQSKLSDLIRPFDYDKLNNLYDLFVPQREKSSEQRYFSERSRLSHTNVNNGKSKEFFNKQTTLLEKRMDESIPLDKKCQSSIEIFKVKTRINAGLDQFHRCLNEEMVADLRYINSLELDVDSLRSQLETHKTQFLNEIDRLSKEYYYAHHINAIIGVYTKLDERPSVLGKPTTFSNSFVRKDFSKSKSVTQNNVSNDFSKPVTAQTSPPNKKSILKNINVLAPGMYKLHTDHNQTRTSQLPQDSRKTNKRMSFSTGVIPTTSVSRQQLKSNQMGDRVMRNNSQGKKHEVDDQSRNVKSPKNKTSVTACNDSLNVKTLNVNFVSAMCDKCVLIDKHDMCVLNSVAKPIKRTVASESNQKPRNITRKLYERVSNTCSWWYLKFTPSRYKWKPKSGKENVNPNTSMPLGSLVEIVLFIVDFGCSKHMTGNIKLLINFVEKFLGTVKFGNDQIAPVLGYGDLVQGAVTIKRVYYVEGLNHNLFSVGQFCDADLEVAFQKSTCFIRDLTRNDLLIGSRGTDLYSITLQDTNCPNPICLMAKASSSQAWLWHRRLSHLNFDTINLLSKNDIVVGPPKLKFIKDHLCSSCELGKAKQKSFHTKLTPSSKRRLQLLHMDLCGPMWVASINGKRYVLVQNTLLI
nr:hypothetical protein [Tanacetum cinerariifolium]